MLYSFVKKVQEIRKSKSVSLEQFLKYIEIELEWLALNWDKFGEFTLPEESNLSDKPLEDEAKNSIGHAWILHKKDLRLSKRTGNYRDGNLKFTSIYPDVQNTEIYELTQDIHQLESENS